MIVNNILQKENAFMNIPIILKELAKVGVVALTEKSVETFVETKIKPIFENWGKEESRSIELEECLSEYLLRSYGKNNIMTTIVFGKQQKTLEDLYIPLTLEEYRDKDKKWVIDEECYNILDNYSRLLIIDMAGMGKSTVVKYFACQGVNLDKYIPIVIELRRLEKNQSILEYIQMQINSFDKNIKIEEIIDILKKGDFVIFFDGYDEIANENKSNVLDAIQEFTSKATQTKIIITSREEDDLNSLGEYKCVSIKPLTKTEAYELITKYDNSGEISKKLINRLEEDTSMKILKEFLENPLLVSLLYKTFEYKEEIPYKKIDFYEQVYTALFNDHDKTKGSAYVHEKKSKLDKFQFEQILRAFGFLCLKEDKIEYSPQLIYSLLKQSIERFGWLKISVDDFLNDITHAVPFIQKDGNEYKWVHKSFMEYFASCFICYDNKEFEKKYFEKIISNKSAMRYRNILDFCFELDTLGFRKYVILPYLERYFDRYKVAFNNEYFSHFEETVLSKAKQIYSLYKNIHISNYYKTKQSDKEFMSKVWSGDNITTHQNENWYYSISFDTIDEVIFSVIHSKMSDLFVKDNDKYEEVPNLQYELQLFFNDEINNEIYHNIELFNKIVNKFYEDLQDIGYLLMYEKCKELLQEIKEEIINVNNICFDW